MKKWKILESIYLLESRFGNVRQDKCLLPNNLLIENYIVNEYPEWVTVVAITSDKNIIFVKQYRRGCGDFFIEIPGGMTEDGEDAGETIVRELREETGYGSDEAPILIGDFFTNPASATNKIKTFLILNAFRKFELDRDETETMDVVLIPIGQIEKMIGSGEISQFFTVAAFYVAKDYITGLTSQENESVL